jgi:Zn-dependent peptidase ImmA (M78 family)
MSVRQIRQFYGESVTLAREYRGLTKRALAERSLCARETVAEIERGAQPSFLMRQALTEALGFPLGFFESPPPRAPGSQRLHFRAGKSASQREQRAAAVRGAVLSRFVDVVGELLSLPSTRLVEVSAASFDDAETAAEATRKAWGISLNAPLTNVSRTLEAAGVLVGSCSADERVSGYSWFDGERPLIMANVKSVVSRKRLTLAHELGHLVMHRGLASGEEQLETQAFRFAGALLVPRGAFINEFPRPLGRFDWQAMIAFKERWGLSLAASIRRASDLGLLSAAQERKGYIALSRRGWRTSEPGETNQPEVPRLLRHALDVCSRDLGVHGYDLADRMGMPVESLEELVDRKIPEPENEPDDNVVRPTFGRARQ